MASNYPGSLDSFDTIASDKKTSDAVGGRTHRAMHNDLGDAIESVQTELGTDPAGTFSTVKARLDQLVAYAAKTSAYTATVADHTLNVTSGTFTLDLPAASTCTGQSLKVKNSGTGLVTLDGNSSETVEGVATFPLGPGSYAEITSTGSAWILAGGRADTGNRNVSAALEAGATGDLYVRRQGSTVTFWSWNIDYSSGGFYTIPSGFRPNDIGGTRSFPIAKYDGTVSCVRYGTALANGWSLPTAAKAYTGAFYIWTFSTPDAWPTSLPGTAA